MDTGVDQQGLESEMVKMGEVRHNEQRARYIQRELETARPAVNRLFSGCVGVYANAIRDWIRQAKRKPGTRHTAVRHLEKLAPDVIASISARIILNSVSTKKTHTRLCVKIGEALEAEINFNLLKKKNPTYAERSRKRLMRTKVGYDFRKKCAYSTIKSIGIKVKYLTPTERLHIGSVCADLFIKHTGLVKVHKKWESPKRWVNVVIATDECMQWITKFEEAKQYLQPRKYPSLDKPKPWGKNSVVGGYYSREVEYPFVKTRNKQVLEAVVGRTDQRVFDAVNRMQGTGWRVNKWLFEIMHNFWKNGIDDGKEVPMNKLLVLPSKPKDGASVEEIKAYSRQSAYVYSKNAEYRSQRLALAQTIYTAQKFLNAGKIHFPCQLDFRGRVYYVTEHLNPQGSDYAKALLEFSEGQPLNDNESLSHLLKYGAGLFGLKGTLQDCTDWLKSNRERIRKSVNEPWNFRWWQEAKEPWQFLRWCKEYVDMFEQPNFKSYLPVTLDCTASGLQILSLLTGDAESASHTNLNYRHEPSDIYGKVLGELHILLRKDDSDYARFWESKGLDRKLTKPVCMTLPYGSTLYGIRAGIEDWYRTKHKSLPNDIPDFWKCTMYLAKQCVQAVKKFIPKGMECMEWLASVASPVAKANSPVCWISPSGFLVAQPYMASSGVSVKTNLAGKFRYVLLQKENLKKVDDTKQKLAVSPNFIHSLDASILHLALCGFEHTSVVAIHDCFGTHANFVSELTRKIKASMVSIFKDDQLVEFKNCISRIKPDISLPNNFARGDFDAGQVWEANYIFG